MEDADVDVYGYIRPSFISSQSPHFVLCTGTQANAFTSIQQTTVVDKVTNFPPFLSHPHHPRLHHPSRVSSNFLLLLLLLLPLLLLLLSTAAWPRGYPRAPTVGAPTKSSSTLLKRALAKSPLRWASLPSSAAKLSTMAKWVASSLRANHCTVRDSCWMRARPEVRSCCTSASLPGLASMRTTNPSVGAGMTEWEETEGQTQKKAKGEERKRNEKNDMKQGAGE